MSAASLTRHFKTLENNVEIVANDLSNLSSACLTDCGAPTIQRNNAKASTDEDLGLDLSPYFSTNKL
jgi:hypothetical protein